MIDYYVFFFKNVWIYRMSLSCIMSSIYSFNIISICNKVRWLSMRQLIYSQWSNWWCIDASGYSVWSLYICDHFFVKRWWLDINTEVVLSFSCLSLTLPHLSSLFICTQLCIIDHGPTTIGFCTDKFLRCCKHVIVYCTCPSIS